MKLVICFILIFGTALAEVKQSNSTVAPPVPKAPATAQPPKDAEAQPPKQPETVKPHTSEPSNETAKTTKTTQPATTPSPPTTTLAPVYSPSNEKGRWNVTDSQNRACILITGFITLHNVTVSHPPSHETTFNVSVPPHAPTFGNCEEGKIGFVLDRFNSTLQFKFTQNTTHNPKEYYLNRVDGWLLIPNTGNSTIGFKGDKLHKFTTNVGNSFECNKFLNFNFTDLKKDEKIMVNVELRDFQLQAFRNTTKNDEFGEAIDGCPADHETPDIVPIIVGCALAILVVAVLVAYLISRQRSQARGYMSM